MESNKIALTNINELKKLINVEISLYTVHAAAMKQGLLVAIESGKLLKAIKAQLPHGKFLSTLRENGIEYTQRTVQRYLLLAEYETEILAQAETNQNFSINAALDVVEQKKLESKKEDKQDEVAKELRVFKYNVIANLEAETCMLNVQIAKADVVYFIASLKSKKQVKGINDALAEELVALLALAPEKEEEEEEETVSATGSISLIKK